MKRKSFLCALMAFVLLFSSFAGLFSPSASAADTELDDAQRNAISMLNYITVLTQDINASKNSRLYMEEAYSNLINNTYPNAVDNRTLSQLTGLLDIMEKYRMIAVKRERLQFIYEQNQAQAIRAAVPNPLGLLSAVQSGGLIKLATSIAYMAVDSVTSYQSFNRQNDLQYIQDGWALDDEEAATLHESRKGTFSYMVSMVRDYNLPGDLTLTESTVEEFVKWKNSSNNAGRIQFLESNRKTYQSYGGYWLLLAESYYRAGSYQKCLESINEYESVATRIFRYDYDLARVLPLAISAADEVYKNNQGVETIERYAQMILDNTDHNDWALRYFVAQTYVDLYGRTNKIEYLKSAYSVALDNVTYLVDEQHILNNAYLGKVEEVPTPKDATKDQKAQIKQYNKMLKEARKTELPPVYEPLQLNCDLLLALADKLNVSESEKKKIDNILHPNGETLFLTRPLEAISWSDPLEIEMDLAEVDFAGTAIKLPAALISEGVKIEVAITEKGSSTPDIITDWTIASVNRGKGKNTDFDVFTAIFTSEQIKKHDWNPDGKIVITITPKEGSAAESFSVEFKSVGTKNAWYDYLKVWKGQNNEWYDYLKVWDNKVVFERVS